MALQFVTWIGVAPTRYMNVEAETQTARALIVIGGAKVQVRPVIMTVVGVAAAAADAYQMAVVVLDSLAVLVVVESVMFGIAKVRNALMFVLAMRHLRPRPRLTSNATVPTVPAT